MFRRRTLARLGGAVALIAPLAAMTLYPTTVQAVNAHANYRALCPNSALGSAHCQALVVTDAHGTPMASTAPMGLSPATIDSVYGFPGATSGKGATIAIVDAYDDPTAASDLSTFSSYYGIPCTNCFSKVNQTGGTTYPQANSGWALEISLDIEWAHAIAPEAHILLVEASSNSFTNLMAAEDYAKTHATYVSNSWGGSESSGESAYDSNFVQSGVSFFVAAGDSGLPAEYPSSSPDVISVGGTTLNFDSSGTFLSETGWSSGGGGCSAYETANPAQSGFSQYGQVNCGGKRATPDVALDADPNSGVSVYDTTAYYGQAGWFTVGGTSASTPMWAAASADKGVQVNAGYVYANNIDFRDIAVGNNGAPCLNGYDLCSGLGSWLFGSGTGTTTTTSTTTTTTSPTTTTTTTTSTSTTTTSPPSGTMSVVVSAGASSNNGPHYKVPLTVSVNEANTTVPIGGAGVTMQVYAGSTCSGSAVTGTGTTGSNGQVTFTFSAKSTGSWCALATVTASGYTSGSGQTTFSTPNP